MLAEVLSPQGLAKARTVMELQDILAEQGNGRGARSSRRFSWSVFGSPGAVGRWGLRVEGHHLSLSFAVADGEIVSVTPSAFAALPNRVTGGRRAGLVALQGEEQIARRIEQDLSASQRRRARVDEDKLFNILSSAGEERAHTRKVGLALAEMQTGQRDLLWQLVETYAVEPFAAPIAEAQRSRIRMGDAEAVHFAWHGPNQAEVSFGYRVIADNVVIELGCIDGKAQHLHPVYHDLGNVLASDA